MKDKKIKIDNLNLSEKGIKKAFGFLESKVMEVAWESKDKISVRKVFERLSQTREIAYTTVMTTMDRLYKKGLLFREKFSKGYVYWPALTEDKLKKHIVKETLKGLYNDMKKPLMSYFSDADQPEDIEIIETFTEIIDNLKKEGRENENN